MMIYIIKLSIISIYIFSISCELWEDESGDAEVEYMLDEMMPFENLNDETYYDTNFYNSTYNNSVVITDEMNEDYQRVQNILSDENLKKYMDSENSIYVRCPKNWISEGPFCITLSVTQPFTECSFEKRLRYYRPKDPYKPMADLPGICFREESIGISYNCPESFYLHKESIFDDDGEETVYTDCRAYDAIPFHMLNFSSNKYPTCPRGMVDNGHQQCSTIIQRLSPGVICPSGYKMDAEEINDYVFNDKRVLKCKRQIRIKGKLRCPEGYYITGELFSNVTAGAMIPDGAFDNLEYHYSPSLESEIYVKYGLDRFDQFKPSHAIVCAQALSVLWLDCDQYQCKSPYLKHLKDKLLNWAFRWLVTDPTYILKTGIPSGRDTIQVPGIFRPLVDRKF